MEKDLEFLLVAAEKVAKLQKILLALMLVALMYSFGEIYGGLIEAKELELQIGLQKKSTEKTEWLAGRIRSVLGALYPGNNLRENDRLRSLVEDIRRAQQVLIGRSDAKLPFSESLDKYIDRNFPGNIDALKLKGRIQDEIAHLQKLLFFNRHSDNAQARFWPNLNIDDIPADVTINSLPSAHGAYLLIAACGVPTVFADVLSDFADRNFGKRSLSRNWRAELETLMSNLRKINEESDYLNTLYKRYHQPSMVKAAEEILDEWKSPDPDRENLSSIVRQVRYSERSVDTQRKLLNDLVIAYSEQLVRKKGDGTVTVPEVNIQVAGIKYLFIVSVVAIVLIWIQILLAKRSRSVRVDSNQVPKSSEIKFGYVGMAAIGYPADWGKAFAIAQCVTIAVVPLLLSIPLLLARGSETLWVSLPFGVCALALEVQFSYYLFLKSQR